MIKRPAMFAWGIVVAVVGGPLFVLSFAPWSGDADGLWGRIALGAVLLLAGAAMISLSIDRNES